MSQEIGKAVLRQEAAAIDVCATMLGDAFGAAVTWILGCQGRTITCGIGKSGHIARKTAGTLSSTGTPSLFLHAAEAVHGDLGMVTEGDVVILYTHSGETDEIVRLFPSMRAQGAKTVLITGKADSSAAREADLVLCTGVREEACPNNLAPTTSTTVMLALSDALAVAVMEQRGFSREEFALYHPSGALGKRLLLRVSDVMRPIGEMATVAPEAQILDVMRAITTAGVGAACVIDSDQRLLGFISDGDLRRHLLQTEGNLSTAARWMMSTGVSTIEPDLMAVEALERFQNLTRKIGEMPVEKDGRLVGLLMLKDLLRSGIL